jgi:uncharacterized protein (TIGR03435 family)
MTYRDLSPLANHLWQSTLFAAAMWALALALRHNRAAVRYGLWLAASIKFLLPFSLLLTAGSRLGWRTAPAIDFPEWSFVAGQVSQPFAATAPSAPQAASAPANLVPAVLLAIWLSGVAAGLVFWLRCWRRMRAIRRAATPAPLELAIPALYCGTRLEPGVFGIREPVLLLPEGISDRLSSAQFQAIVAHELCHVRRRDNLTAAFHMMVEVLFWFHPLVWWIRARLIEERERACDEAVLQSGGDASVYAEGILNVCRMYAESPLVCLAGITGADLKSRIARIVEHRAARDLNLARKLLLAGAGILSLAGPIAIGIMNAPAIRSQTLPTRLEFEAASVKVSQSQNPRGRMRGGPGTEDPGQITFTNVTLFNVILRAYDVKLFQLSAPDWLSQQKYDIAAKVPPATTKEQGNRMLQTLLADRFHLSLHHESRELQGFELTAGRSGPKLKPAADPDAPEQPPPSAPPKTDAEGYPQLDGPGLVLMEGHKANSVSVFLTAKAQPVSALVELLSREFRVPVLDKTGLTGKFDFKVEFAPHPPGALPPEATDDSAPNLTVAIQQQLGLRLNSSKITTDVLIVDRVDRVPVEN